MATLDQLKKEAKRWLKALREGSAEARARFERAHPNAPADPGLRDVQHALARERGFERWTALKRNLTGESMRAGQMTDDQLARIASLHHVTELDLSDSRMLTDAGLQHLARMPQLQLLRLNNTAITDRGLTVLRHLRNLRTFQMTWQQNVTDAGVANLAACEKLENVNLMGTETGDGAIAALVDKPKLRHLKTGRHVTDAGLAMLHRFPVFKTWQGGEIKLSLMEFDPEPNHLLLDGPFTDAGVENLAGLEGLFGLAFFWHTPAISANALPPLAHLPHLGFFVIDGKLCDDTAMRHIAAMPHLRMLLAQGTIATDEGFVALSRSRTLEYLWGRECPNLTGRGFAALSKLETLRGLGVSCKRVDDAGLATLPDFPSLRELMPMDVNDDGFRHVGRCENLEALWCMYCRDTTDAATEHIKSLRLKTYYAGRTRITDRSLAVLATMHSLERVLLWETQDVTDEGVRLLATLPKLHELSIEGLRQVTPAVTDLFPANVRVKYEP